MDKSKHTCRKDNDREFNDGRLPFWFYIDSKGMRVSPFFHQEEAADIWFQTHLPSEEQTEIYG